MYFFITATLLLKQQRFIFGLFYRYIITELNRDHSLAITRTNRIDVYLKKATTVSLAV